MVHLDNGILFSAKINELSNYEDMEETYMHITIGSKPF